MSKEEYSEQTKEHTFYYNEGKRDERKKIIKLINEKIDKEHLLVAIVTLKELKKELETK